MPKFYHGTSASLKPGDEILPPRVTGKISEKGRKKNLDKVFFTQDIGSAKIYSGRAKNALGGSPVVYEIKPVGSVEVINKTPGTTVYAAPKAIVVKPIKEGFIREQRELTNWVFNAEGGKKLWNMLTDMLSPDEQRYLVFRPNALTADYNPRGAFVAKTRKSYKEDILIDRKTNTFHISSAKDPRAAQVIYTTVQAMPQFSDYKVAVLDRNSDSGIRIIGTAADLIENMKTVVGKVRKYIRDDDDDDVKYDEYKYLVFEDISDSDWYHATLERNLESIKKKGLLPSTEFEQGSGWTQLNLDLQNAVYLTSSEEYAYRIAETVADRFDEPSVVLKVDGDALQDKSKLVVDEDSLRSPYDGAIDTSLLEDENLPNFIVSVVDSIESIGYSGKIPPKYIQPIERFEPDTMDEEVIGKKGGLTYFQMGGSLPDELYNVDSKTGKATRDPGVQGLQKEIAELIDNLIEEIVLDLK